MIIALAPCLPHNRNIEGGAKIADLVVKRFHINTPFVNAVSYYKKTKGFALALYYEK
ncbi:hypothetical protein Q4561_12165 [Alteromonas sp. 1_MG-2023]|uniref:hypothetical protein n=1 Tax=Alteromonas sp. 1_MG-2023 TaxID=3062669 RepID=UPI0026E13E4B|nr:hypothetical protein [Alteromonas sp. 1_MG-2023]MDO6567817.1 hypothetical protein [Alteromonas sp. 1_MG-2023]